MISSSFSFPLFFLFQIGAEIWSNPEIRFVEYRAHDLLTRVLEDNDFEVTKHYILPTGFRAEFSAEKGKYSTFKLCNFRD